MDFFLAVSSAPFTTKSDIFDGIDTDGLQRCCLFLSPSTFPARNCARFVFTLTGGFGLSGALLARPSCLLALLALLAFFALLTLGFSSTNSSSSLKNSSPVYAVQERHFACSLHHPMVRISEDCEILCAINEFVIRHFRNLPRKCVVGGNLRTMKPETSFVQSISAMLARLLLPPRHV